MILNSLSVRVTVEEIEPVVSLNTALCITLTDPSSLPPLSNCCTKVFDALNAVFKEAPVSVAVAPVVVVQCILASVPFSFIDTGAISFTIVAIFVCC